MRADAADVEPDRCQGGAPRIAAGLFETFPLVEGRARAFGRIQTGRPIDIQWAFNTLVAAADEEGWFDRRGENITTEPHRLDPLPA